MAGKVLTPSAVRDEPLIKPCRAKESVKTIPTKDTIQEKMEQMATGEDGRGDLLNRGFVWARSTDYILVVRVTDTDAKSYSKRAPAKALESQENEKKRKYLEACLERRCHFTPFSAQRMNLRQTSSSQTRQQMAKVILASMWIRQCSAKHCHCSRQAPMYGRKPSPCKRNQHPISHWKVGAGLSLFEC
jgi:hypothetical protein